MKKYIIILISFLFIGCSYDKIYENRESDKQEAQKITDRFYSLIKQNNKEEAFKLFNQETTSKEKFYMIYDKVENENGAIKDYKLSAWQTFIVKGTNSKADYLLTYDVTRNISNTKEFFLMQKENDTIKIIKSRIDFDIIQKK
ncbi:hypothetical protein F3J23_07445 [Chryseobacterium sp. Tr-659]|uniref:hypothetical protein n=1 Tax=Chryseobacterium sp. Tr-659 TaxID=2608340 RepID=UPI00141E0719|nr:hypothetical protein [Chryseobacterium sp. Tr-659]NIF05275.1 hypothetical protein [Chryseobacterium sp. Tr-659]